MYTGEEHENIINELIQGLSVEGVDQSKVSILIQNLRENYNNVSKTVSDSTSKIENMMQTNEGLRSANMQLLSKLGTQLDSLSSRDKEEVKKGGNEPIPKEENVMSYDDIASQLI